MSKAMDYNSIVEQMTQRDFCVYLGNAHSDLGIHNKDNK